MSTPAIATQNLTRRFGSFTAVDDVSFQVAPGQFFGFLGPNGAGKSTTIKMLTGLLEPTAGAIEILGQTFIASALDLKRQIGVVPENMALLSRLTASEYLRFVGRMYGLDRETTNLRTQELLDFMQLANEPKKLITDFSHGMQKKLALAAAVIHGPKVLFLDEPFEGVDAIASGTLKTMLQGMIHRGATIFLTSHVLEIVERLCSHVAIIHKGKLVANGSLEELRAGVASTLPRSGARRKANAGGNISQYRGRRNDGNNAGAVVADLGVNIRAEVSVTAQYGAVAQMRWRMLVNSLRTRRGGFEIGARILTQGFFAFIGLSVGVGLGFAAWQIASHNSLSMLAILLWSIFVFWQVVPIAVSSFHEIADLSIFLRFPVGFGSYLLLYILFGLFDIGSLVGGIGLFGIWIGASLAQPNLFVWITLALALFAIFNIFLTRMIFAWINRWLAQRKTREILGAVFLFLMLGAQFLNPTFYQHRGRHQSISHTAMMRALHVAEHVQSAFPPGSAANAISRAHTGNLLVAGENLIFLALYGVAAGALLGIRLGAEYRGESLGETPAAATKSHALKQP